MKSESYLPRQFGKPKKTGGTQSRCGSPACTVRAGGGYPQTGLSDIALEWMVQKAGKCGLAFNRRYLSGMMRKNPLGKLHDSYTYKFWAFGEYVRCIGVTSTDESVHSSVEQRWKKKKSYRPKNLVKHMSRKGSI